MKVPISFMGNTSIPSFYTQFDVNANSLLPYDIAPGCTQNFTEVLAKELSKKDDMYIIDEKSRHCFMPTISTLDINTANLNLNVDNSFPIVNNLTPFKAFHAPDTNEAHVKITSAGRGFLNSQIALNTNQLNNVVLNAGDAYNFGGDYSFLNNFTVGNGANVGINRPNIPTGHPNSGNAAPIGVFDAHTGLCGITIEDGGLLEVGSGWDNRVTLRVLNGSTVRIKKGGKIIVHGYSKIIVEEGGTLIVEDGGQINYWGNNTSNPATLRIEGTLIVEDNGGDNTDKAEFFGSGHMEVANTATFDIQEDAHLSLDGQASNDRILDLEQNARFGVEEKARLTIRNGNVNYEGNSTIYVENKGYLTMVALNLNGVLSANAIESDNPERIIVSGVSFRDFGIGVLIYNGTTNAELNYAVMSSTFTNCEWGIVAENTTSVKSSGNVFNAESNGTLGIWCIKTKLVKIANNLVDGYLDKGISLDDVPVCQVKNTIISNSVVGIYGRNKSNVFLSHNSILQNNTVGIELYGDKDDGMVSMNCATLDNNGTGILGTDVLLDIDAEVHSYDPNYISPNSFKNFGSNQRIFDICYKDRNITEIFAKNNYWDGLSTLTPNIDFRIYKGTGACNGSSNVALITANATTIEPQGCNYQNITATGGGNGSAIMMTANQCSLSVNSQAYAIETQYKLGDEKFKEEQFEEADLKYAPVSALEGPVRDGSSTPCRHYIDVAHVMVKVEEILNTQKSGSSTNPFDLWDDAAKMVNATQRIATLTAYPNPASDVVTIRIMDNVDGRGIIKLYNTLGQEVYANSANGNIIEIPVKQLSAGFYRAEWISNAGNWSGVAKVVVQ
jgi:hypothetical protein